MKLEVYGGLLEEEEPVRLKLVVGFGSVVLQAVDDKGEVVDNGNILQVNSNGTVERRCSVNPDLGFKLDSNGRVIIH